MSGGTYNVLFLCRTNAARSIMAEAILRQEGLDHFFGYSAGSYPVGEIHPYTADLMTSLGHKVADFSSKPMEIYSEQDQIKFDFVFTVCDAVANEDCPIFPGSPMTAQWGVPDPVDAKGSEAEKRLAFADTYRMLRKRISIFKHLPFRSLDRLSLQSELDKIGKITLREDA